MKKRGRPTKLNPEIIKKTKELTAKGKNQVKLREVLGVSESTIFNWKRFSPEFMIALREGQQEANEIVEASLFQKAIGYTHPEEKFFCFEGVPVKVDTVKHYAPDTEASKFWLKNRNPERWKELQSVEATIESNSDLTRQERQLVADLNRIVDLKKEIK